MTSKKNPYRLDRSVVPSSYRLFLTPDLDAATFTGRVEIDVDVKEEKNSFTLNAKELELSSATFTSGGNTFVSTGLELDHTYETATYSFDSALPTGNATIEISFSGVLNDYLHGFYLSKFTDSSGVERRIATTQFEHSYARLCFPCWDEPSFKATYQVNLTVPSELACYSNNPEISNVDLGNGLRAVSYSPTMVMSTYLVAFCVGPFEATDPVDVDGVPLRVIYPIGKGHLTDLAMEAGQHALRFFSSYFDIPYPGEKLDMIAIPDFANGAMENLGLVTYRETALLVDEKVGGLAAVQRVAEVVAHEIAHMWFGDLVTMEWWEGIWLNEAFATFCATLAMEDFRPEWNIWTWFACIEKEMALIVDGLHTTRPIEYEVISPDDTQGMFDVLTYEKGGAILRMLQQYLGEETYRNGIRRYLKKHAYKNTVTTDLWDAIEEESGEPVRELMNSFIYQGGHPLVSLENGTLSQRPFSYGEARGESAIGSNWLVPVLTGTVGKSEVTKTLLGKEPAAISTEAPVILNVGGSGVFRSHYGAAEYANLTEHFGELSRADQTTLMLDTVASLMANDITWNDFLAVARPAAKCHDIFTLEPIASALILANRALTDEQRPKLQAVTSELFAPVLEALTWQALPSDDTFSCKLRGLAIQMLGAIAKDPEVIAEGLRRFDANDFNGDLALAILRIAAEVNRPGTFDELLKRSKTAATPQDGDRYRMALGWIEDEKELLRAAELCFSEFRNQDGGPMLGFYGTNRVSGAAVWRYVTSRWDEAIAHFPINLHTRIVGGISTYVTDEVFAKEVEQFHKTHILDGRQKTVDQAIERMWVGITFTKSIRQQF
jgi:puromycin-sensitive aminopeptidase